MRRVELDIEHRYKNRFVGRHRLKGDKPLVLMGSSREADIRLLGDDVGGVHASLELSNHIWTLMDLGSEQGTWVKKRPVLEHMIQGTTIVNIGGHQIKLIPREIESDLFLKPVLENLKPQERIGADVFHQVILRRHGFVIETKLLPKSESFHYRHGNKDHVLKCPDSAVWTKSEFGDVTIQQRLIDSKVMEEDGLDKIKAFWDPSLRGPMLGAVIAFLLVIALVAFLPKKPAQELVEVKPDENRYTRMIFDAKQMKKDRAESQKVTKAMAGKTAPPTEEKTTEAAKSKAAAKTAGAQAVKTIRASGLGALIGKISKNASKNAVHIQATGKNPDEGATGQALSLGGGSSLQKAGVKVGGNAEGQRIAGVTTDGKGGGSSAYRGVSGLVTGNVGTASVGVLEEETDVQGGLDRDVIARIIKSQIGQIRYCYERQLSANPELYGKVQVKFTIGSAGAVVTQTVGSSSLNNAMVEGCILRRIAGWQFPKPAGGTDVIVTYPFLFKSTR